MDREILNIVNRVLSEELSDKLSNAKRRIFEGKKMCSECGSDMKEGMCSECGYNEGEVQEKLIGKQSKLDKNENGKLDSEDFRLLRKSKRKNIGEKDVEEGNAFTGALAKAREKGEENFKVGKKTFKVDESVYRVDIDGEKYLFNESEMIDVIENIVLEEKKKKKKTKSIDPIKLTKDNISKSGKENEDYINSVIKKMKDYLKDGSKGDYNMNPKDFPRGNGEIEKMEKMAYVPSNAVQDYTDNFTAAGLENLDFNDGIQPNDKWMDDLLVGASRTGNNPDWANAVETPTNEKRNKIRKDNLLSKLKRKAYNKSAQPVINDKTGNETDKASKIMMNLESKEEKKVVNDIEKMKNLMEYYKKTQ
jgi:hypothetical protein